METTGPVAEAHSAVVYLTNLYALAVDTQRWDLFDEIFTEDVVADYPGRTWSDLTSWKQDFAELHAGLWATQHLITNHVWKIDGDEIKSICYGHWLLVESAEGGGQRQGRVWYDDVLVRIDDDWRINRRGVREIVRIVQAGPQPGRTLPLRDAQASGYLEALTRRA
jgi:hypothetical protein